MRPASANLITVGAAIDLVHGQRDLLTQPGRQDAVPQCRAEIQVTPEGFCRMPQRAHQVRRHPQL